MCFRDCKMYYPSTEKTPTGSLQFIQSFSSLKKPSRKTVSDICKDKHFYMFDSLKIRSNLRIQQNDVNKILFVNFTSGLLRKSYNGIMS